MVFHSVDMNMKLNFFHFINMIWHGRPKKKARDVYYYYMYMDIRHTEQRIKNKIESLFFSRIVSKGI